MRDELSHGDQSKSKEIKVWTCIEMVKNRDHYKRLNKNSLFADLSGKYEDECLKCAIDGKYSSGYMLQAAASALGLTVTSIYPCLNGLLDKYKAELNRSFYPRQGKSVKEVFIMWTSTYTHSLFSGKEWVPNHFCPLIETESNESNTMHQPVSVENCQADKGPSKEKTNVNSGKSRKRSTSSAAQKNKQNKRQRLDFESPPSVVKNLSAISEQAEMSTLPQRPSLSVSPIQTEQPSLLMSFTPDENNLNSTPVSLPNRSLFEEEIEDENVLNTSGKSVECENKYEASDFHLTDGTKETEETQNTETPNTLLSNAFSSSDERLNSLPDGKYLSVEGLYGILKSDIITCKEVPYGKKENVYIVLNNEVNITRKLSGKNAAHHDDLGAWDSKKSRTCKTNFLLTSSESETDGRTELLFMIEKEGVYYTEKRVEGKKTLVPLDPQPSKETVITLHRCYTSLKRNNSYKKRVSWFTGLPENLQHRRFISVVEYLGNLDDESCVSQPHGNSKVNTEPYTRTKPGTIEMIKDTVQHATPAEAYEKLTNLENSIDFPRNLQQCRNFRKNRDDGSNKASRNEADEILEVIKLLSSGHPYVAEIIHARDIPKPIIICYTSDQLLDFRSFLASNGGVIGVDRTFMLGPCYVTTIVFKSHKVVRRETGEPPIMMGPLMLHWDGKTSSYLRFFSHIKAHLGQDINRFEILFGTDDEKALTNAIDMTFPSATRKLCSKHIKDNIIRHLTDKIPKTTEERNIIVREIFGPTGVATANDSAHFSERNEAMKQKLRQDHQDFLEYYEKYVEAKIADHCIDDNDSLWTNNNTESMNHRLKQAIKWNPKKTDDLVEQLYNVVRVQMTDLRRALYGTGNFSLAPRLGKHKLAVAVWHAKSEDDKHACLQKFLKLNTREKKAETVTSVDGQYTVRSTQNVAKKPNQKTRVRSTKTRTPMKH